VDLTANVNNAMDLCLEGVWFESYLERIFQEYPRRVLGWSRERFLTSSISSLSDMVQFNAT
jgi:hypothetical protein